MFQTGNKPPKLWEGWEAWQRWQDLPELIQCGLVWAFTWWGPSSERDLFRIRLATLLGEHGWHAFCAREEHRWLVEGLTVAFPGMPRCAAYRAVSRFMGCSDVLVRNMDKDIETSWKGFSKTTNALQTEISIRGVMIRRKLPGLPPYDPLRMGPHSYLAWHPFSDLGRLVDLGPGFVQKQWRPLQQHLCRAYAFWSKDRYGRPEREEAVQIEAGFTPFSVPDECVTLLQTTEPLAHLPWKVWQAYLAPRFEVEPDPWKDPVNREYQAPEHPFLPLPKSERVGVLELLRPARRLVNRKRMTRSLLHLFQRLGVRVGRR